MLNKPWLSSEVAILPIEHWVVPCVLLLNDPAVHPSNNVQKDDIVKTVSDPLLDSKTLVIEELGDELRRKQRSKIRHKPHQSAGTHAKVIGLEI